MMLEMRQNLEKKMQREFGDIVLYGPYLGMHLHKENYWGLDSPAMRFGLYEKEVLDFLVNFKGKCFINIGAGDGYYAVGELFRKSFQETICFESDIRGRQKIQEMGELNGVSGKLTIKGAADENWLEESVDPVEVGLVLCDAEGAEFDIFNINHFRRLANCPIIIEIHDWVANGEAKIKKLIDDSSATHVLTVLKTGARDLSEFTKLRSFSDEERWLIVVEGRPRLMSWFVFTPKEFN